MIIPGIDKREPLPLQPFDEFHAGLPDLPPPDLKPAERPIQTDPPASSRKDNTTLHLTAFLDSDNYADNSRNSPDAS
ncbi:MAG: hypothetical protein OJF47_000174 [Nitrospira sp.]|nr:MAG: hypothetical protein OJF47_000174 [Nitrospira sp.]